MNGPLVYQNGREGSDPHEVAIDQIDDLFRHYLGCIHYTLGAFGDKLTCPDCFRYEFALKVLNRPFMEAVDARPERKAACGK